MKKSDIPQDIWDTTSMLWGHDARIGIASAVMAERNRCADLASELGASLGEAAVGAHIASAIRHPQPKPPVAA